MLKQVVSPKENIAEQEVVLSQEAQTLIKEAIVKARAEGWPKARLELRISAIIEADTKTLPEAQKRPVAEALATNAQRWHYLFENNVRAIALSTIKSVSNERRLSSSVYAIDVKEIAGMGSTDLSGIVDKYRPLLTEDKYGAPIIEDYAQKVKQQIRTLASDPANLQRIDRNGKPYTVNMRNFSEMTVRYEANLKDVQKLKDGGVKLVWTSSHADASARCSPYQGRLYSLDGTSGTIDGIPYTPLDDALEGPRGDGNGIINGYNCRHRLIEYQRGTKSPKDYDEATIRRENAVNNRQRQYERDIRNLKIQERLERANGNGEDASALRKEWQSLNSRYQTYSLKNGRPFYEWRTRITQDEESQR